MILTKKQLDLIWNIEILCRRCVRGAYYFNALPQKSKNRRWAYTHNSFGGISIIYWCQVFGSNSEPTHYSNLLDKNNCPITKDEISRRLCSSIKMNKAEYKTFWQGIKDARDCFFVHNEFNAKDKPKLPNLTLMSKVCLEMRVILLEVLKSCSAEDEKFRKDILHWVSHFSNDIFLEDVNKDIPQLQEEAKK